MLCPSISVNLFDVPPDPKCPCNMTDCKCMINKRMNKKTSHQTVPLDPKYNPKKRANHRYHPPNVCITVNQKFTDKALAALFANGVRMVHVQMAFGTRDQLDRLILKVHTAIAAHYIKNPCAISIAVAMEIGGRVLRTGRMRNDQQVELSRGQRLFVTSNEEFKFCSTKDVIYVSNLNMYLNRLVVGEFIFINRSKIRLLIVKVVKSQNMWTCCVLRGSTLDAYMEVILPYLLDQEATLTQDEQNDCTFAVWNQADFVVVPVVSNAKYLESVRSFCYNIASGGTRVLSEIESTCFADDRRALDEIICSTDGLWWRHSSKHIAEFEDYAFCKARQLCKPIVFGPSQLKSKRFQQFMADCDCLLLVKYNKSIRLSIRHQIHRSDTQRTQKTSPELRDLLEAKTPVAVLASSSAFTSITLHAHLIVCVTINGKIPIKISQFRPMCPILTIVSSRKLGRLLSIFKNVLPVLYKEKSTEPSYMDRIEQKLKYGIETAKKLKLIAVGDLVVYCFDNFEHADEEFNAHQTNYLAEEKIEKV